MQGERGALRVLVGRALLTGMVVGCLYLALTSCSWALAEAARWHRTHGAWRELPLDLAVTTLAAVVLAGCAAWLALVTALAILEAATGRSSAAVRHVTPHVVRRLVAASLGLAVAGGAVAPASAVGDGCRPPRGTECAGSVTGLPLPDRAVGGRLPRSPVSARPISAGAMSDLAPADASGDASAVAGAVLGPVAGPQEPGETYVVGQGDSLWRIAARRLPVGAPAADVDAGWRSIYRLNRHLVGEDPDVLAPGLRLQLPTLPTRKDPS